MGDEIGGHNVSGHVHTCAEISDVEDTEYNRKLVFQASGGTGPILSADRKIVDPAMCCIDVAARFIFMAQVGQEWMKYILPKGFIAVDGCSLTVCAFVKCAAVWVPVFLTYILTSSYRQSKGCGLWGSGR